MAADVGTKVLFFSRPKGWYRKAMQIVTGGPYHHVGFLAYEHSKRTAWVYDMNKTRRRRRWADVQASHPEMIFTLVACPVEVPELYLHMKNEDERPDYGYLDYLGFLLRPLYHLVGLTSRNMGGMICSEQVFNDLCACGWDKACDEVPSPTTLYKMLKAAGMSEEVLFPAGMQPGEARQ